MIKSRKISDEYLDWMTLLVQDKQYCGNYTYNRLLLYLYQREFTYQHTMDANREIDGINLRYRFGHDAGYSRAEIESACMTFGSFGFCSVLEMMVALAYRCEEEIMYDPDKGFQVGRWFWIMISSLGLLNMHDDNYDEETVELAVTKFLECNYSKNGKGGLFTINRSYMNCDEDLRNMEIWNQMCWYLDTII